MYAMEACDQNGDHNGDHMVKISASWYKREIKFTPISLMNLACKEKTAS